jgi:hypothetical protein
MTQKTHVRQPQPELKQIIARELRRDIVETTPINELNTLAARLNALRIAAGTGDLKAARAIAKESSTQVFRKVAKTVIEAIERGEGDEADTELHEVISAIFLQSREGVDALHLYYARLRSMRGGEQQAQADEYIQFGATVLRMLAENKTVEEFKKNLRDVLGGPRKG